MIFIVSLSNLLLGVSDCPMSHETGHLLRLLFGPGAGECETSMYSRYCVLVYVCVYMCVLCVSVGVVTFEK